MKIEIRRVDARHLAIKVIVDDTTIDLGLADYGDCTNLIEVLEDAIYELRRGWDY